MTAFSPTSPFLFADMVGFSAFGMLDVRVAVVFHACLMKEIPKAVDHILKYARSQLVPEHGYDTGKLHDLLTVVLVTAALNEGVVYTVEPADQSHSDSGAWYWAYMEDGFMMQDGTYWPGYHYILNAVNRQRGTLGKAVKRAWRETAAILNIEANLSGVTKLV